MKQATLAVIISLIVILTATFLVILLARGYQFNLTNKTFSPTGILVATSDPDGAEVLLDGKLVTATNTTLNLAPGSYDVQIQKDGFTAWKKQVVIKKEEVYKTNAFLFPRVPDLRPLTFTGAQNPSLSPDNTKIVFGVASASGEKNGIWIADMGRSPLPGNLLASADLRLIFKNSPSFSLSDAKFLWSSDAKQILAYYADLPPTIATPSAKLAYLLDTDRLNDNPELVTFRIANLLTDWETLRETAMASQVAKLNPNLAAILATTSANLQFSPDNNKILYTATSSASLPNFLSAYLPGTDPTPENRQLTPGQTYVYDTKEDKNFLIAPSNQPPATSPQLTWFPSSRHLLVTSDNKISVIEYDGGNPAVVFSGPFIPGFIAAWPNWSKLVILTSLNAPDSGNNLYTVNFR